nr:MAG TPA: hypothetical protein [Caudoviricetes sp.]
MLQELIRMGSTVGIYCHHYLSFSLNAFLVHKLQI